MTQSSLSLDAKLSADNNYLYINPDIRFRLDSSFYQSNGYGSLNLMPKDISISTQNPTIPKTTTEYFGIEKYGLLLLMTKEGDIGNVNLTYICDINRKNNHYIVRHSKYKKDDLFVLYLEEENTLTKIGMGVVNFEEELVAKLTGFGISNHLQKSGSGTAFLAAIEHECAKNNLFLLVPDPLRQAIPFYVHCGYRYLELPGESYFAKVLNPTFDEQLLMPTPKSN